MSESVQPYSKRLQEEVKIVESCLERISQLLVSPETTPLASWSALLQDATTERAAKSDLAEQAGQRLKVWIEESKNKPATPFDDSDLGGEALKADNQADKEESAAMDAVLVAAHAVRQAEVAILKAFKTRKTAEDLERFRNVM